MNIETFSSAMLGLSINLLLYLWKKGSGRWSHWFPVIRLTAEWSLKIAIAAAVLGEAYLVLSVSKDMGVSLLAGVLGYGAFEGYLRYTKGRMFNAKDKLNRGARIATVEEVRKQVFLHSKKKGLEAPRLHFGEVPIPRDAEPYHFAVMGTTGTGKSVTLNQFISTLRNSGDTVILVDSGGDFLAKHFQGDTDFVFNPYDDRCINWSPLFEIDGAWDADSLARSIIPDGVGDNKEWNGYAQTFLTALMTKLLEVKRLELRDLLYYALVADMDELREFMAGTAAIGQLGSDKTFGSIRNILTTYLNTYRYLPGKGEQFSVAEMVKAEHSGILFMTYRDDQLDSLRHMMACLLDVVARSILSLKPNPSRRIWLIIDEFASLGKIQTIEAVATKARKAGGCLVLGLQTISQMKERYGEHGAQTVMSCLNSWLVLRAGDGDTAEYISKYIGESELTKMTRSVNQSDSGDTQGKNEQQSTTRAVMASEMQALPNLQGFARLSGGFPICRVELDYKTVPRDNPDNVPYQKRDFANKPLLDIGKASVTAAAPSAAPAPVTRNTHTPEAPRNESAAAVERKVAIEAPTIVHRMPVEQPQQSPLLNTHVLIRRPVQE